MSEGKHGEVVVLGGRGGFAGFSWLMAADPSGNRTEFRVPRPAFKDGPMEHGSDLPGGLQTEFVATDARENTQAAVPWTGMRSGGAAGGITTGHMPCIVTATRGSLEFGERASGIVPALEGRCKFFLAPVRIISFLR